MKRKQFTEEQIIAVLKEAKSGLKVADLVRKHGIAEGTYYRWKAKYGGMDVSDAKRLKQMDEENRRLKRIVADQALDIQMLK
ncbi:MAG TPA: transposase, partial [Candidatus Latescibacteria bacterium]|nr:transposase [Candidatus Latescibacterota bacterium]